MKILYAVQGTGNGHLSRARDVIPALRRRGEVDLVVSGTQADVGLAYPVKYRFEGLSFIFGKKGGVDILNTYRRSSLRRFLREVKALPVEQYDLIINDFEPVSAWAAYLKRKQCIALSHQCAILSPGAPRPKHRDTLGKFILTNYAPASAAYGFHFDRFNEQTFTPVIRRQVRELPVTKKGHYTVYLPSYDDKKLIKTFSRFRDIRWIIFSKHNRRPVVVNNVEILPIDNDAFVESMASSNGILCGAGFETPAEALFLGKKLMVIPMKNQYEQHCNAAALKAMGVPVLKNLKKHRLPAIEEWIAEDKVISVNYPDLTESIVDMIFEKYSSGAYHAPSLMIEDQLKITME